MFENPHERKIYVLPNHIAHELRTYAKCQETEQVEAAADALAPIDTDCPEAQEAKRLGIAAHDAIVAAHKSYTKANGRAIHDTQEAQGKYQFATKWSYHRQASNDRESRWIYHLRDADITIYDYDQEDQS